MKFAGLYVDVKILIDHAQATGVEDLSHKLDGMGVDVSARTLYRWKSGKSVSIPKFVRVITGLKYPNPMWVLKALYSDEEM